MSELTLSDSLRESFLERAILHKQDFFNVIQSAGCPYLGDSPFNEAIYRSFCCDSSTGNGVLLSNVAQAVQRITIITSLFRAIGGGEPLTFVKFKTGVHAMVNSVAGEFEQLMSVNAVEMSSMMQKFEGDDEYLIEVFDRHDRNENGELAEDEFTAMLLMAFVILRVFTSQLEDGDDKLSRPGLEKALQQLGFTNIARLMQGQLADSTFARFDDDHTNKIAVKDFLKGTMRLFRPINYQKQLANTPGFPGLSAFMIEDFQEKAVAIQEFVNTLQMGDVILMRFDDPLGQYIQFGLDSPWSHAAVVIKFEHPASSSDSRFRQSLDEIPNAKTEALLMKYPFRRASHHFCSPGFCRCYDKNLDEEFHSSNLHGTSQVMLLESTGEGCHLYDFAHRVFESGHASRYSALAVRRRDPSTTTGLTVEQESCARGFIADVRGSLYTTKRDEMRSAMAFHEPEAAEAANVSSQDRSFRRLQTMTVPQERSHFCSKLVAEFYKAMGWLDSDREISSVMPCDFDDTHSRGEFGRPVTMKESIGTFLPLEVVWSPSASGTDARGVPLQPPRKKNTPPPAALGFG